MQSHFPDSVGVVPQILLVLDHDYGNIGAEALHLWRPLLGDVLERESLVSPQRST